MRYTLKEAKRQTPVLTNRNGIRGIVVWGKQAHHCNAPMFSVDNYVDAAAIGGGNCSYRGRSRAVPAQHEKSAEVIVVTGNEPASVSYRIVGGLTKVAKDRTLRCSRCKTEACQPFYRRNRAKYL